MFVKGRGADRQVANRFLQRHYGVVEPTGIDEPELGVDHATQVLPTFPRTILNRVDSPDLPFTWSLNPYQGCEHGCSYCYARPTHEYWGYSAGLDFERVILVKREAAALLEKALRAPAWAGEPIMLSGATDPYQPVERQERLTRACLELCLRFGQPVSVITKNALVTRDIDLLAELARERRAAVAISLTTLNEDLRRVLEPRTSTAANRLKAMELLAAAGVPVFAMIAPVIPALNEPEIPALLRAAREAGAVGAGYTVLRTNGPVEPLFRAWLQHHFPDRAAKVIAQTSALHGGRMSDGRSGVRMRGEGAFALQINRLFTVMRRRIFGQSAFPALDSSGFNRPPQGQLELFPPGEGFAAACTAGLRTCADFRTAPAGPPPAHRARAVRRPPNGVAPRRGPGSHAARVVRDRRASGRARATAGDADRGGPGAAQSGTRSCGGGHQASSREGPRGARTERSLHRRSAAMRGSCRARPLRAHR